MSQEHASTQEQPIEQRELSSIEVTEVDAKRGSFLVRADQQDALELMRRLIDAHYKAKPERAVEWYRELEALIRQLGRERATDQWEFEHAIYLFDAGVSEDSVTHDPSWELEVHAGPGALCIITFKRHHPGLAVNFSGRLYPDAVGKEYIDAMQSRVLEAMQAR